MRPQTSKSHENILNSIILFSSALLIYSLMLVFLFRRLNFMEMWGYGDLNPFTKDFLKWTLYAWKDEGLGSQYVSQNYLGLALQYVLILLLGENIAQKFVILLPFIISFLSFYYFALKQLTTSYVMGFLASLLYSINPVTAMAFVGGGLGYLMTYSLIPLVFHLIIEFFKSYKIRHLLTIIVLSIFFWNLYVTFWMFLMIISSIVVVEGLLYRYNLIKNIKKTFLGLTILIIGLILIFAPSIIQFYFAYLKSGVIIQSRVLSDVLWNYKDINIFNLLRFAGNHGSAQPYLGYNSLNYFTYTGLVLEALIVASLLFYRDNAIAQRKYLYLVYTSVWLSLIASITILILIKHYPYIVTTSILLATLRNPEKLMYIIAFDLATLFAIVITYLYDKSKYLNLRYRRIAKVLLALAVLSLILSYNMPIMDGTFGLRIRKDHYLINSKYYKLEKILENIYPEYRRHRILIIPFDYYTLVSLRATLPNYFGLTIGPTIVASGLENIYNALLSNNPYKSYILSLFDVKLIIIDKKFRSVFEKFPWYQYLERKYGAFIFKYHNSYFILGNPLILKELYLCDKHFKLIYEDSNFAILENLNSASRIYITFDTLSTQNLLRVVNLSKNLISNYSFKEGLKDWIIWPRKCASLLNYSLRLEDCGGNDHAWTIAYTLVPVRELNLYELSFCIKFLQRVDGSHVKVLWYNQTKKLADKYAFKADFIKLYSMNFTRDKWYCIRKLFKAPVGAKLAKIEFLIGPKAHTVALISKVSFTRIAFKPLTHVHMLAYDRFSPTFILIRINSTRPFTLFFAETYDPFWEIKVYKNGRLVELSRSIPALYGLINSFQVNATGNLTIVIRYVPQDWFELGLKISATTFALCIFYLVWDWRRGRGDRWAIWLEKNVRKVPRLLKRGMV